MFHQMWGADPALPCPPRCWEKNQHSLFEQNCCELPELQITFQMSFHSLKSSAIAINGLEDYLLPSKKTFASWAINKKQHRKS